MDRVAVERARVDRRAAFFVEAVRATGAVWALAGTSAAAGCGSIIGEDSEAGAVGADATAAGFVIALSEGVTTLSRLACMTSRARVLS
jgi:hypothetical protein